jgi:TonB family protein
MAQSSEKKFFKIFVLVSVSLHLVPFSLLSFVKKSPQVIEVFLGGDGSNTSFSFDPGRKAEAVKALEAPKLEKKAAIKKMADPQAHDMKYVTKNKDQKLAKEVTSPAPVPISSHQGEGKVASEGQGSGSQGTGKGGENGGNGGKIEGELQKYIREMVRRVDAKKRYPRISQENGEEGIVPVKLIVGSSGEVLDFQVLKNSEFSRLNEATRQTIKEASPFPPLPSGYDKPRLVVEIPVRFRIASR